MVKADDGRIGLRANLRRLVGERRIEGRLLLAFLIVALLAFAFIRLASEMSEGDTIGFDRAIIEALRSPADPAIPIGPEWLRRAMLDITALGGVSVLTLLTVIVAFYLLVARKAATGLFVAGAILGGGLVGVALKALFERPRPDVVAHLVDVSTTSFPSGHATNSAVVFLTLGALLARTQKDRAVRLYLMGAAILLTLAVGTSRVYLGVHWPSDVAAGWCVGAAWATLCAAVARLLQMRHTLEQPTEAEEEHEEEAAA